MEKKLTKREVLAGIMNGVQTGDYNDITVEDIVAFCENEIDLLVCTTIIESGLDIPNCNTIIIEGADKFGLAQLYVVDIKTVGVGIYLYSRILSKVV